MIMALIGFTSYMPSQGVDQEIHPSGQGRIDSVKINPSLLRMREWMIKTWCNLFWLKTTLYPVGKKIPVSEFSPSKLEGKSLGGTLLSFQKYRTNWKCFGGYVLITRFYSSSHCILVRSILDSNQSVDLDIDHKVSVFSWLNLESIT